MFWPARLNGQSFTWVRKDGSGVPADAEWFLVIETYSRNPHAGFRIVHVSVWSSGRELQSHDLGRRGMLLIRCLKYYLMATEENDVGAIHSDAEILAAILA